MDERITQVTSELKQVANDARASFGSFTSEQLNWKPAENSWSIAQCLDHLIKSDDLFKPEFEKLASGNRKNSLIEQYSPLSGFFGRFLIKTLAEDSKKTKAPTKAIVPPSEIDGDIIDRFSSHIDEVSRMIEKCAPVDRKKTILTSPFFSLGTYSLDDAYSILIEHTKRHFRQAKRVTEAEGFPGA